MYVVKWQQILLYPKSIQPFPRLVLFWVIVLSTFELAPIWVENTHLTAFPVSKAVLELGFWYSLWSFGHNGHNGLNHILPEEIRKILYTLSGIHTLKSSCLNLQRVLRSELPLLSEMIYIYLCQKYCKSPFEINASINMQFY